MNNAKAMTQPNAPVTAEIRKFSDAVAIAMGNDGLINGPDDECARFLDQLLANFVAERERLARVDEAKRWNDYHYDGFGGPDCDIYWNQHRIAELESAGTEGEVDASR